MAESEPGRHRSKRYLGIKGTTFDISKLKETAKNLFLDLFATGEEECSIPGTLIHAGLLMKMQVLVDNLEIYEEFAKSEQEELIICSHSCGGTVAKVLLAILKSKKEEAKVRSISFGDNRVFSKDTNLIGGITIS